MHPARGHWGPSDTMPATKAASIGWEGITRVNQAAYNALSDGSRSLWRAAVLMPGPECVLPMVNIHPTVSPKRHLVLSLLTSRAVLL